MEAAAPLLLPKKPETGRPRKDHRQIINGILWILRTGASWRDFAERYGPWQTVHNHFNKWRQERLWKELIKRVQMEADIQGNVQWEVHFVDSTMVRAHQHAAGVK